MLASLYRHDGWNVGLIRGAYADLLNGGVPAVEWLPLDGRIGFSADPFLIEEAGTLYCFFESLPYATDRGKICYVTIDAATGRTSAQRDAIVEPYHLSYPFLLRHEGEIVCIPEAAESGRISAYCARNFPDDWYRKRTIVEGFAGVDNTFLQHGGRWWMFATDGRSGTNTDLLLWHAEDLFGDWRPHKNNPVKRGLAGSRPAGTPFVVGDALYRPAQDCALRYGHRLVINEILELSTERFVEREVAVVEADAAGRYPDGLHTANAAGGVVAVDGNRIHLQPRQAARALTAGLRKRLRLPFARAPRL